MLKAAAVWCRLLPRPHTDRGLCFGHGDAAHRVERGVCGGGTGEGVSPRQGQGGLWPALPLVQGMCLLLCTCALFRAAVGRGCVRGEGVAKEGMCVQGWLRTMSWCRQCMFSCGMDVGVCSLLIRVTCMAVPCVLLLS